MKYSGNTEERNTNRFFCWFMCILTVWYILMQTWLIVEASDHRPSKTQSTMTHTQHSEGL